MDAKSRKEMFEGKERYAERRMMDNSEVETLTAEQHDALSWLCKIRHEMHSNIETFFNEESAQHSIYWDLIDAGINDRLRSVDLSSIGLQYNEIEDYNNQGLVLEDLRDEGIDSDDDEYYVRLNEELEKMSGIVNRFNREIENYLRQIDNDHGTQYCPTGIARLQ